MLVAGLMDVAMYLSGGNMGVIYLLGGTVLLVGGRTMLKPVTFALLFATLLYVYFYPFTRL